MKRFLKMTVAALVLVLGSSLRNTVSAQYDDDPYYDDGGQYNDRDRDVSYQTFYDELSPHGRWVEYPGQGYVWVPDAGPDFRPYSTNGHWVYSDDYEWMWVSDYDWGWAPFHYGRWDQDQSLGWYWVPGYDWSPAWVAWRDGGDYYGWAPIRPGINISINFNIGGYSPPVNFWCFAPRRYITSPRVYDYCVDSRRNVSIINYTSIIINNNRYSRDYGFRTGPRRYDAERYTGRINPVRFRQTYQPGRSTFRNNEVSFYRPNVRRQENTNIAPRRFDRYDANTGNRGSSDNNVFRRSDNSQVNANSENRRFDRTDRVKQQQTQTPNDNRRFERTDNNADKRVFDRNNNPGVGNRDNNRDQDKSNEVIRQQQQQQQMDQRRRDDGVKQQQNEQRRFERSNDDAIRQQQQMEQRRKNDDGVRQQQQQMDQRRRNDDAVRQQQQQQQMDQRRRNDDAVRQQQQQQQMEQRRNNDNAVRQQQQQQQVEQRRFERTNQTRPEPQPQQNRVERRDNGNTDGNGNGGGRNSKRRFEPRP